MAITGITVVPLDEWPEKERTRNPREATFKANWFATEILLARECREVSARNIKLYTFHSPREIRQSGWVRSDARKPRLPGVVFEFEKRIRGSATFEKLRFPCDTFSKWEDNVRAIALALEALRKVDRYGVTTGAQYAGYKALPPAEEGTEGQTSEQAAEFIAKSAGMADAGGMVLTNPTFADLAYKTAAKNLHPDKGGDAAEFAKLEGSMRLVRESFGKATSAGGGA